MTEKHANNNPWASKLQEARLPEINESWRMMEATLNREMPLQPEKDKKRWFLLALLILLLAGVCNCPGREKMGRWESAGTQAPPVVAHVSGRPIRGTIMMSGNPVSEKSAREDERGDYGAGNKIDRIAARTTVDTTARTIPGKAMGQPESLARNPVNPTTKPGAPTTKPRATATKDTVVLKKKDTIVADPVKAALKQKAKPKFQGTEPAAGKNAKKTPDPQSPVKGWVVGIGLNQFFTVGGQARSDYNSGGTTGGLGDYLPVPMARYFFSRRVFVQMEAQFNAPQYTKKDLLADQSPPDTIGPAQIQRQSVYIKKLFYFNLPVSVHLSPFKNLFAGIGLQYSRLSNGVGLFENKLIVTGAQDSVKSISVKNFKGDSTYQKLKTNEFRLLADVSYEYKNFILGARYNRALNNFINVHISGSQVTQSRNSSIQLYIRYILWDQRKKRKSSSE